MCWRIGEDLHHYFDSAGNLIEYGTGRMVAAHVQGKLTPEEYDHVKAWFHAGAFGAEGLVPEVEDIQAGLPGPVPPPTTGGYVPETLRHRWQVIGSLLPVGRSSPWSSHLRLGWHSGTHPRPLTRSTA